MTAKLTVRHVKIIHEDEFSTLISELHGRPYSYQQAYEKAQDTIDTFWAASDVTEKFSTATRSEIERWKNQASPHEPGSHRDTLWWERESEPPFIEFLAYDLVERGLLEPGEYRLHTYW